MSTLVKGAFQNLGKIFLYGVKITLKLMDAINIPKVNSYGFEFEN